MRCPGHDVLVRNAKQTTCSRALLVGTGRRSWLLLLQYRFQYRHLVSGLRLSACLYVKCFRIPVLARVQVYCQQEYIFCSKKYTDNRNVPLKVQPWLVRYLSDVQDYKKHSIEGATLVLTAAQDIIIESKI